MNTLNRRDFIRVQPRASVPRPAHWMHVSRTAMACRFEVTFGANEPAGVTAAQRALDEIDAVEEQLSVFRASSEISYVNRTAAREPAKVQSSLFELLLLCRQLYEETQGCFDVTAGPLTRCWGFLRREGRVPTVQEIDAAMSVVGTAMLGLDHDEQTVTFAREGIEVNFGSIGKGYALDRALKLIRDQVGGALLNAGSSSLLAFNSWVLGIRDPRDKTRRLGVVRLHEGALATSGSEEQYFISNGKRYGHILDPRSGKPADKVLGVTVATRSAAVADALATAFYIGGAELAQSYCESHDEVLAIILEAGARTPVVIGNYSDCEVELSDH